MKIKMLLQNPMASGAVLVLAALVAMIFANSPLAVFYHQMIEGRIAAGQSAHFWINDVLMAVFFLLVGLEIKRELVIGELSIRVTALQPVFAAIGGVMVPVFCFMLLNHGQAETMAGWAIPCATDIAFALGVLALLGSRVPSSLVILLTAIAIIDDLIAILVIGLFYTQDMQWHYLLWVFAATSGLVFLNRCHVRSVLPYLVLGACLWLGFYKTGLHPTMAGVVTALAIPVKSRKEKQDDMPLIRLEHALYPWVAFLILPLFAFANAGLSLTGIDITHFRQPLTAGIMLGLMVGKPVGIMAGLYLGHRCGWAKKPAPIRWTDYTGIAFLCGIGFTMSLFIGELGFESVIYKEQVKLGVLTASLCMALAGWFLCRVTLKKPA